MISSWRNARERVRRAPPPRRKQGARLDGSMTIVGKFSNTRGCCPVCGHEVALQQSFNGARLQASYGCYRCGPTTYTVAVRA